MKYFLDTNVLVYMFDRQDRRKQERALTTIRGLIGRGEAVVSSQVVQEFINVALRKFRKPFTPAEVRDFLDQMLWPICEVFPDRGLYTDALSIVEETGWTFYDSLIVSAAARAECPILLSEDLQPGRTVRGVEVRNPFLLAQIR
jgi:predicted nucleic acid-binding protein